MFYITLILPLVLAVYLYIFHRKKVCLWEYCLLFGVSAVSYGGTTLIMYSSNVSDTEYFNDLGTSVRHYERWNEYIHKTCSTTTCSGSGKDEVCTTTYYDCSYVEDHSEYWVLITQSGREYNISQSQYNYYVSMWKTDKLFVEMDRNFYTIDGDASEYNWNAVPTTAQNVTTSHSYDNKTQAANTLFKFKDMEPEEADSLGLFEYPNEALSSTILGATVNESIDRKYQHLNGLLGHSKEIRVYILYFWGKGRQAAFDQKVYWKGGNKNELVICVGVDPKTRKVTWVESFSWAKTPIVESKIKGWYSENQDFNINKLYPELMKFIEKDWHRRNFTDFDYIEIELSENQMIWVWVILSMFCIGTSIWVVKNGIDND